MTNPANAESIAQYWISGTLEILNIRYPIYLKTIPYEPDTDTDSDIIIAMLNTLSVPPRITQKITGTSDEGDQLMDM